MSLKVWLPLNGNAIQRGSSSITMSGSPASWDRNGQIGKCAKFSENALYNSSKEFDYTKNFSFAMWIKVAGNGSGNASYAFTVGRADMGGYGYGIDTSATSLGFWFGNQRHSFTISTNKWYHVAQTVDENKIRIYIDGELKGTYNVGTLPTYSDGDGLGIGCFRMKTNSNFYFFNGYLNDFRIYDHCLSVAEIKELSRGLVAHYSFDNIPNLNLLKSANVYCRKDSSGGTDYAAYSFELDKLKSLPVGTKLTVSCRVKLHNIKSLSRLGIEPSFTKETSGYMYYGAWRYDKSDCDTILSNTYTLSSKITGTSQCGIYIQGVEFNSGGYAEVSQPKLEIGDHRTEWCHSNSEGPYIIEDNSGNGYSGNIVGYSVNDYSSPRGNSSIFLNGHRNPYLEFRSFLDNDSLKDCTISYWMNWTKAVSLLFTGQSTYSYYLMAGNSGSNFWHTTDTVGKKVQIFKDGVLGTEYRPTIDGWHFFTLRHVDLSKWTVAYINNHDTTWHNTGNISDLRIYSTPLSDEDIMKLYNSPIKVSNKNVLMIDGEFIENGLINIAAKTEQSRAQKKWSNGLSSYTQAKCQCSLTDEGYRIYRPANLIHDSNKEHNMYGGFVLDNSNNHLGLIKGHSYVFMLDVKGKSSNYLHDLYWSNNVGWGGGGLEPLYKTIAIHKIPSDFNSSEFKTFYFTFNIPDDIYKKCTKAYSSFKLGETYISYKGLKFGYTYSNTGSMGTDLYIKNIRLYDITGLSDKQVSKFCKTGNIECTELNELRNICEVDKYGNTLSKEFVES